MTAEDRRISAKIVKIINESLGAGHSTEREIRDVLGGKTGEVMFGAFHSGKLVGVASCCPMGGDALQTIVDGAKREGKKCGWLKPKRTGFLKMSVVKPSWRGRQVGRKLLDVRLEHLVDRGFDLAVCLSWDSGSKYSSGRLFDAAGFTKRFSIRDCWKQDTLSSSYKCPKCGRGCTCRGVVYSKKL